MTDYSSGSFTVSTTAYNDGTVVAITYMYYMMCGTDVDIIPAVRRFWTVKSAPDNTGAQYVGPKAGATPLQDIAVLNTFLYTGDLP